MRTSGRSYLSSFIVLQISLVCPVFASMTVLCGKQLQVTVLLFSCLTTTQCSMSSAVGGGNWLRTGGGVAATGCFFAAQPARSRQNAKPAFLISLFSRSHACLSMAILVTPAATSRAQHGRDSRRKTVSALQGVNMVALVDVCRRERRRGEPLFGAN